MLAQGTAQMVEGRIFNRKKKCDNVSRTRNVRNRNAEIATLDNISKVTLDCTGKVQWFFIFIDCYYTACSRNVT